MDVPAEVKNYLDKPDIHKDWIKSYRTKENEVFFNNAFNKIIRLCNLNPKQKILDAGCGSANHAMRLAKKGFYITAIDFSESVLDIARSKISELNLAEKITLKKEDLTQLTFENNSFDVAYCWGVLMHIPDAEAAVSELSRIVKPGGYIIISEVNKNSVESLIRRLAGKIIKSEGHIQSPTKRGVENWYNRGDHKFLVRQTNISWLTREFKQYNFIRQYWITGQFSEAYASFNNTFIKRLIHGFNYLWFKFIRIPQVAQGNILIFKKEA